MRRGLALLFLSSAVAVGAAHAQGVRSFTRLPSTGTAVTRDQASEITLTLTDAATRPIQTWVRTSGTVDKSGRVLTAFLRSPDADIVAPGQRVSAYPVTLRTRKHLGKIESVTKQEGGARVAATLPIEVPSDGTRYLMEIVVERGPYLSIPNVSIIEEGDKHIVYLEEAPGKYSPREIEEGLQGELYTQVVKGLKEGDQVVSVGSFFVDAENKLKSSAMAAMPGMDHGSMPGMDHSAMAGMQMAAATPPAAGAPSTATRVTMTDPEANAKVKAPLMIHVMFNNRVDPKASGFEVTGADGKRVDVGDAMAMGNEGNMLMAMPKAALPPGNYRVKWHAVDAGGKKIEGEFSFTAE